MKYVCFEQLLLLEEEVSRRWKILYTKAKVGLYEVFRHVL